MRQEILSKNNDATLISTFRLDKRLGIEMMYNKYWNRLVRYAHAYLRDWDSAEEMVQELFINIYVKNISLNENLYLSAYLYRAVKNAISNHLRKQSVYKRHLSLNEGGNNISKDQVQGIMESFDVEIKINKAVKAIPEKLRVVYILNREYQLTIKEISKKLKRPEDTIDKQLRRAVYFLRNHLSALAV